MLAHDLPWASHSTKLAKLVQSVHPAINEAQTSYQRANFDSCIPLQNSGVDLIFIGFDPRRKRLGILEVPPNRVKTRFEKSFSIARLG
ncbi:hypothetical protein Poly51_56300 [Rubripirellula tenax]|uniref:Uncharacterized protein n=1 Tax=Rubripirellula tenax TaxID=2528015 RepID=A0A5C6ECQ5_9BACT|nr:hypothetical protein Poly51_56300 [Rubripirellula tenax]